jgi:hypothetical protein
MTNELLALAGLVAMAAVALWYFYPQRPKGPRAVHFKYVWIDDDGSAREVTPDEFQYLNTKFEPFDGARPYIKATYEERTPNGRICGFLPRKVVPRHIEIRGKSVIVKSEESL